MLFSVYRQLLVNYRYLNKAVTGFFRILSDFLVTNPRLIGDRGSTVVKVLCYKSEGRWLDPSLGQWIFH